MTNFDNIRNMSKDELAHWIDDYGTFDGSPWMSWFNRKYCDNCKAIMCRYEGSEHEFPCSWCELESKCKFFLDLDKVPDNKMTIKMWLESEIDEKND